MAIPNGPKDPAQASLQGYSDLIGLGHSPKRLAELEPQIRALLGELSKLWEIDLGDTELAVKFRVDADGSDG